MYAAHLNDFEIIYYPCNLKYNKRETLIKNLGKFSTTRIHLLHNMNMEVGL